VTRGRRDREAAAQVHPRDQVADGARVGRVEVAGDGAIAKLLRAA
jgi:hypothetical protein